MPAFKTILVPIADAKACEGPLTLALGLAGRFASHVTGLHARLDATTAIPLVGEGMSGAMVEEMIAVAEGQSAARAAHSRAAFEAQCARHGAPLVDKAPANGLSAQWKEDVGREEDVVALHGRLSDLLVFGHPGGETESAAMLTLNTALLASGRPLLLVPDSGADAARLGEKVVIAWNGSTEAARAVAAAMPFLRTARSVNILLAEESMSERVSAPAGEVVEYLAWHGIPANAVLVQSSASQAGEALLREAVRAQADLLVMGAYTHSRLRQLILGGVTRHVIAHAPLAVLMSH